MELKYLKYIQELPINQYYKTILADAVFIEKNPSFYLEYPSLFSNTFNIAKDDLEMLDIAGYLQYHAVLYIDLALDEKDYSRMELISICQEESVKILTSIYALNTAFWAIWNKRRREYFDAVSLEKEFYTKNIVTIEEYALLADKKAAFGKTAIDCLYVLDDVKNTRKYECLLLSHKYFSVAYQLKDDIKDLKEDVKKGQFNLGVYLLKEHDLTNLDPGLLEKHLHVKGVSKDMYLLGVTYCNKALEQIESIDVPKWKKILEITKKHFEESIIKTDSYLNSLLYSSK